MHKALSRSRLLSLIIFAAVVTGGCGLSGVVASATVPPKKDPPTPSVHTVSHTASFSYDGTAPADVTVGCPANELALGGGYQFEVIQGSSTGTLVPFVYVTASLPSGNGWKVSFSYTTIADVTVYVQCLVGGAGSLSVQSANLDFPTSTQIRSVAAVCPAGSTVVGGGFSERSGIEVVEDFPSAAATSSGWASSFKNDTNHDFLAGATVFANCYSLTQPLTITRDHRVHTGSGLYDINYARTESACKPGTSLTAGGYMRLGVKGVVNITAPIAPGGGWEEGFISHFADIDVSGLTAVIACVAF